MVVFGETVVILVVITGSFVVLGASVVVSGTSVASVVVSCGAIVARGIIMILGEAVGGVGVG